MTWKLTSEVKMSLSKLSRRKLVKRCIRRLTVELVGVVAEAVEEEINRERKQWVRGWLGRRDTHGASALLLRELATEDIQEYQVCLRMTPVDFEKLLELVTPKIKREDTLMRDAILPRVKLEVTLNFLATGNSYRSLSHFFRVSTPAISKFIPEVCDAIVEVLGDLIRVSY